ncbi:tetraspanin-9-like isoform X2 [Montipora capricornis]|uniref:tetraspanin-9-like isoform X3 n=1 Tax=Montipora foliosa TaxID=591990 RepID=UPI0035F1ED27
MGKCLKWMVCTFTTVILLGGSVMLGLGIWITTQDTEYKHFAGNLYVTVAYIVLSSLVFIVGFLGACGILLLKQTLLRVYFTLMLMLLMIEVGLAIYIYIEKDKIPDHIAANWNKTTDESRIIIQQEFNCCGLTPLTLEHQSSSHKSCFVNGNKTSDVRLKDCYAKLMDWIKENHVILATCAVTVAVLQMFILGGTCRLLSEIESGDRTVKRIRVVPQNHPMPQMSERAGHDQESFKQTPEETTPPQDRKQKRPQPQDSVDLVDGRRHSTTRKNWAKENRRPNSILSLIEK